MRIAGISFYYPTVITIRSRVIAGNDIRIATVVHAFTNYSLSSRRVTLDTVTGIISHVTKTKNPRRRKEEHEEDLNRRLTDSRICKSAMGGKRTIV